MRNIPFAFVNEETIEQINRAEKEYVDAFANLAGTQKSMRGLITWPIMPAVKSAARRFVATLEKMMEMSGPNSIANLERALRGPDQERRRFRS